jgi:hypothetical protein
MMKNPFPLVLLCVFLSSPVTAAATVYRLTPEADWFPVLNGDGLQPGDEVVLAAGTYRDGRRLVLGHRGTAQQPILVRAASGARVILHRPDARQNSINIIGSQYLILRGIEITGGSSGIRLMKSDHALCKFVTIEGMHIHHIGGVAVTANSPGNAYEGLIFRRNHIHHTSGHGEGFYLGVNNKPDGSTAGYIFNSIIENNYIHDLKGPNVSQGDGIELKDGSYNNIVRDNVIHDTNYPGVLVYGTDGKSRNVIERNVIWNSGNHGIQAASEAIIRNNIIFGNRDDGIRSHAHQSARVGNLDIIHNTIVSRRPGSSALRISLSEQERLTGPIVIAKNALYAASDGFALRVPPIDFSDAIITLAGNIGSGPTDGVPARIPRGQWNKSGQLKNDLDSHYFPRPDSMLVGAAILKYTHWDDFSGVVRDTPSEVGAYALKSHPDTRWIIAPEFKELSD